jgi:hypothetical protein
VDTLSTEQRCNYIRAAAGFLVKHQTADGDFHPPDSRAGYNEAYDAKGLFTLLQAVYIAGSAGADETPYAEALRRRLRRFAEVPPSGGTVPINLRPGVVSTVPVGAVTVVIAAYRRLTGDTAFDPVAHRCLDFLVTCFTEAHGFKSPGVTALLNYENEFPLYACQLWRQEHPAAAAIVEPATRFVTAGPSWNQEGHFWRAGFAVSKGFDLQQLPHPTLDLDRAWALFEMCGARYAAQIESSIRAIEQQYEALESFYDVDGEHMEECRIRMSLAALMGTFDRYTGTATFTTTATYQSLLDWTTGMFDPETGGFREHLRRASGKKECFGVPGQYLAQYVFSRGLLDPALGSSGQAPV